ncbi:hypothetical protein V8C86DRAFT_3114784 [Haematococcus lacustris]
MQQAESKPKGSDERKRGVGETLLVCFCIIVFMGLVWMYAVHQLYFNHLHDITLPSALGTKREG